MEISSTQRDLMKQCLGLDKNKTSYRNYFYTLASDENWNYLVSIGFAGKDIDSINNKPDHAIFSVNNKGQNYLKNFGVKKISPPVISVNVKNGNIEVTSLGVGDIKVDAIYSGCYDFSTKTYHKDISKEFKIPRRILQHGSSFTIPIRRKAYYSFAIVYFDASIMSLYINKTNFLSLNNLFYNIGEKITYNGHTIKSPLPANFNPNNCW